MQTIGHIVIDGTKILVLVRTAKMGVYFKRRKSGKDGQRFIDEEEYLKNEPEQVKQILEGKVWFSN